ncbi:MAG: HypC/HybG/HupF family hydrogenase formation chaperone [Syntrophothermus sp.]
MCLAVPAKIIKINGLMGKVDVMGNVRVVGLRLVPEAKEGDYVLVHAGFALQVVDEVEAAETLALLEQVYGEEVQRRDPAVGEDKL